MSRLHWMMFVPADWIADPGLRVCSLSARGLWMDMLAIMHQATPIGTLRNNGKPIEPATLAVMVGSDRRAVVKALAELEKNRVFSRTRGGTIYSRRMKAEAEKRQRYSLNQSRRGMKSEPEQGVSGNAKTQESRVKSLESRGRAGARANAHSRASQPAQSNGKLSPEAAALKAELERQEEAERNGIIH